MAKMIATKALTYDMKTVEAGAEFEVADQYVGTLVSLGRATLKGKGGTKVEATTTRAKEEPKEPKEPKPAEAAKPAEADDPGKYKTRRFKAEDDK
jgi:hypothetical protein